MVGLLGGQLEAARNVDLACGGELVVGPQAHALVAGCACEAEALVDEPRAEPLPASLGGDEQDPQDGGVGIAWVGDAEDASDALACELRYPGCFACGVMGLCEVGDDPYDERLEVCIPAELARVCLTVGRYDPAEVARLPDAADYR